MSKTSQKSIIVGEAKPGEGAIHRHPLCKDNLIETWDQSIRTLYESFEASLKVNGDRDCLGQRFQDKDKKWGEYKWESYKVVAERRLNVGSGLIHVCGMQPKEPLGIYSTNRPEWVLADLAVHAYSWATVALYDTLGKDAVEYVINHAEIKVAIVAGKQLNTFMQSIDNCKTLKFIVALDAPTDEQKSAAEQRGIKIVTFAEVEEAGKANRKPVQPPTADDLCTIMYTSGTTGNPKGVLLSHRNGLSVLTGVRNHFTDQNKMLPTDRHLSYLPLAHSFERAVLNTIMSYGAGYGFFHGVIPELFEDVVALKPNFMTGAPRVWTRLHDKVEAKVQQNGGLKKFLFEWGFAQKRNTLRRGGTTPILDKLVFGKTKEALGGQVRWVLSGSAPLDPALAEWLKVVFCCTVVEGYGLTENFAAACVTGMEDDQVGRVGAPLTNVEVKLVDVPDMNYSSKNTPQTGEVCMRGPCIFKGYYKDEKNTSEAIDGDGWFHTGDIGRWNEDGTLSIIDRKKNIFKLAQGEYVAVEYLEGVYNRASLVGQTWVYGSSFQRYLVAVCVPDFDVLKPEAKKLGIEETDLAKLCQHPKINEIVLKELQQVAKNAKLHGFEFIKAVHLHHEMFLPENELTTPTFKLKRPQLLTRFKKEIDDMYEKINKAEDKSGDK